MKNKKNLVIGIVILIIIIITIIGIISFQNKEKISETKKVEGLIIENGKINYENNLSTITAKVTNKTEDLKTDIRLEITFYDKKKKEIVTISGYLGDLNPNESRDLKATVTDDLTNAHDVKYTILK